MHIFILAGAPCVGKTSISEPLLHHINVKDINVKAAFIDCDWVATYVGLDFGNRLALMEANLCACAGTYADAGADCAIFTYAHVDWLGSFTNRLCRMGYDVHVISLVADEASLRERCEKLGPIDSPTNKKFLQSVYYLDGMARKAECDFQVDTSQLSIDEASAQVAGEILRILQRGKA